VWLQDAIDVATHQIHALVDELVIITKVTPGRLRRRSPTATTDRAVVPRWGSAETGQGRESAV
jgi:hypothetical protein